MSKSYGLIGCGMMGTEHIRNINMLEGAEISAVYDPVAELASNAAMLSGGAEISVTLDGMINNQDLDALVIASPNHVHAEQLTTIVKHRSIPILCEKPLFISFLEYKKIHALLKQYSAPIWVAMEYRYMPPIAALLDQVGRVTGGVKMLTLREHRFPFLEKVGNWNRFNQNTGGTLVEKCCHFFDLMRLIIGSEPVSVSASGGQVINHLDEIYDGKVPDIWDSAFVIFDFANGARAMLELCMYAEGTKWNEEIIAIGPEGKIECRVPGPQRFWPVEQLGPSPSPELVISPRHPKKPETIVTELDPALVEAGDHHGATFYQHQKFLDVVRGEAQTQVGLVDGIQAVLMGLAAQKAAIEGCVVRFPFSDTVQ